MKSGLLLAVILPVAFAVKKTNKVVTPVVSRSYRNNKNHARQGSDTDCLCKLSDSDYWEPLADCDCINPDKNFQHQKLRFKYGAPSSSSTPTSSTETTSSTEAETTEAETTEQPSSTSSNTESSKTTILETPLYKSSMLNQLLVLLPLNRISCGCRSKY